MSLPTLVQHLTTFVVRQLFLCMELKFLVQQLVSYSSAFLCFPYGLNSDNGQFYLDSPNLPVSRPS